MKEKEKEKGEGITKKGGNREMRTKKRRGDGE